MFADDTCQAIADKLTSLNCRIVLAESCTAGLIAASLGRVPGVSTVLAGSAVVYQIPTKTAWLSIDEAVIQQAGVVSRKVAEQMAAGVLTTTPHATISASITGHLGPNAPPDEDGLAWCAIAERLQEKVVCTARQLQLQPSRTAANHADAVRIRHERQVDATEQVLQFVLDYLQQAAQ